MGKAYAREFRTKVFKSGNSVAIRLPKELGIEAGQEFVLVPHGDHKITAIPADRRKEHFLKLAGAMSPGWMQDGRLSSDSEVRGESGPLDDAA
jgi:antitoxin VapB